MARLEGVAGRNYSAAMRTSGAAARTSASTWSFELHEVLLEHVDELARGLVELELVLPGLLRIEQVRLDPGELGRHRKPKYGSVRNFAFFSEPSSAAASSVRVTLIGMRRPTP